MNYTSNYKFKLPSATDVIDITVLNSNFADIDKKIAETEQKTAPIQLSDTLEIVSASGTVSFYHGTLTPFNSILNSVKTTWGDAVFRNKYGTICRKRSMVFFSTPVKNRQFICVFVYAFMFDLLCCCFNVRKKDRCF